MVPKKKKVQNKDEEKKVETPKVEEGKETPTPKPPHFVLEIQDSTLGHKSPFVEKE
jgi:hypothetical protein